MGSDRKPSKCETDGCHREPDRKLFIGLAEATLDFDDDKEQWYCEPCHNAIQYGNELPGQRFEVVERAE